MPTNDTTPTKRPKKKKTLAELKEEETFLLKERKNLKRQIAQLQVTCEKQRKENEGLKKMKLDLQSQPQDERVEADVSGETQKPEAASETIPPVSSCLETKEELINNRRLDKFVLPDLNIPAGEEIS